MTAKDLLRKASAALLSAALAVPQGAAAAAAADFQGVDVADDSVTVRVDPGVQYNTFVTQTPPRLILELLDTENKAASRAAKGGGRYLTGVRSSQFQKTPRMITRVVLDLAKMAVYKVTAGSSGLTVSLAGADDAPEDPEASAAAAPPSAPQAPEAPEETEMVVTYPAAPAPKPSAPRPAAKSQEMTVLVPEHGTAAEVAAAEAEAAARAANKKAPVDRPSIASLDDADKAVVIRKKDLSAAAGFKRAGLEGKMQMELVAAAEAEDVSRSKIALPKDVGDDDSGRRQSGGRIYRDLMSRLPRDPVSLDFDNTDVRDVIKLLAAKARINIIYGADVNGTLTLHLSDVPFNEAFRTVISMMQLSTDQVGDNVLRVITPAELTKQRTSATAITKVIPLNYAKAAEIKTTIDQVRQAEGRAGSSSADVKTNSLIVTESLEGMLATENLVAQLDQRPRQVLIEAKLIEVNANSGFNYGIQWNAFSAENGSIGGKQGTTITGSPVGVNLSGGVSQPLDRLGTALTTPGLNNNGPVGAGGPGTGVNLSADRVFGAFTLGRITNNYLLNATLTAAASEGKAKVLSDPKIATLNNQPANINVTTQIPYVTSNVASTGVQTQSVSYVTTGIQLAVTPSINADGRILLVIAPTVSQPSVTAAGSTLTGAPAIDSRQANTSVMVRDGETIVIGGLISDSIQDTISKIPLLGDIPILGWLFKKKTKSRVRNELLIFVTTKILPD